MGIINIKDEQGRYNGFIAEISDLPQRDVVVLSYGYKREHIYKKFPEEKIGIEASDFYERNKEAILTKILKRYDLMLKEDNLCADISILEKIANDNTK